MPYIKTSSEIEKLEKELDSIFLQKRKHWNAISKLTKKHEVLENKIFKLKEKDLTEKDFTPKFIMSLPSEGGTSYSLHSRISDYMFKTWSDKGVGLSGYYDREHNQTILQISMNQNKPFKNQLGVLKWLPYVKADHVAILEHTLSANGSYQLNIKPEIELRGSRIKPIKFKNMKSALQYIYNKHPYIRKGDTSYES